MGDLPQMYSCHLLYPKCLLCQQTAPLFKEGGGCWWSSHTSEPLCIPSILRQSIPQRLVCWDCSGCCDKRFLCLRVLLLALLQMQLTEFFVICNALDDVRALCEGQHTSTIQRHVLCSERTSHEGKQGNCPCNLLQYLLPRLLGTWRYTVREVFIYLRHASCIMNMLQIHN